MYKVIKYFTDLLDNNHPYTVGSTFPRDGVIVTEERLAELSSKNNRQGTPLIQAVEEEPNKATTKKPKKTANK